MTRYAYVVALLLASSTWSASAENLLPCAVAEKPLSDFYSNLAPRDVNALKACAAKSALCILTDDGVLSAKASQELKGNSSPTWFGLVQVTDANQTACLAAMYSGGSAAAWMFDGWRMQSGKLLQIKKFSSTHLNSDSVSPEALVALMQKAFGKSTKGGS